MGQEIALADDKVGGRTDACRLLAPRFIGLLHEEFHVVHLDRRLHAIHFWHTCGPFHDQVNVPVREVLREAVRLDTHALLIAHNHPHGDPTPSEADKAMTRRLADIARALDIRIVDHLVFGAAGCASFRALGLL